MKFLYAAILIAVCVSIPFGQTITTAPKEALAGVEEEIRSLNQRIRDAVTRRDRTVLEASYADEFLFIHTTGGLDTKKEYIAKSLTTDVSSPRPAPKTEHERMDVYGDVAVRTARVRLNLAGGQDSVFWATTVYVKRDGRWQIARTQGTRIPPERTTVKVASKILDAYVGKYEFAPGAYSLITREGDVLMAQSTGRTKITLLPESETQFFVKGGDAQFTFYKDERGRVTHFIIRRGSGLEEKAKKIE